jgi:predicted transcriptional regulator
MHDKITDFLEQIELHYRGLGVPVLYGTLSILANKSVFFIAGRGQGKTRTVNSIPEIPNTSVSNWDSFTLQGLAMQIGQVKDTHLIWKVEEFGTLSKYHRRIFLDIVPKIITDGRYIHVTKSIWIEIENCQLDLLIAIQPLLYSELCRTETRWESMAMDRFGKFLLLNPLRETTSDAPMTIRIPSSFPKEKPVIKNVNLGKVERLYSEQVSRGRKYVYARDYLSALASFLGEKRVTHKHVNLFYDLFSAYLEAFNQLQFSKDLESSIEIQAGQMKLLLEVSSYNSGVTKKALAETFKVSERNIEKYAAGLLEHGLISKDAANGRGKQTEYHLAAKFQQFFKDYSHLFSH